MRQSGCNDVDYDDSSTADLNLLISHVFGAAYWMGYRALARAP